MNKKYFAYISTVIVVLCLAFLYTYIPLSTDGGYVHIDTGEILVISRSFARNGHLWFCEPLNAMFEHDVFTRQASVAIGENHTKIVPWRDLGIYLFTAFGGLFGGSGPFLLVGICGLIGSVFLYMLAFHLFGNKLVAVCAAVLHGFSPWVVYWSNSLLSNIPALTMFIGSTYFMLVALKEKRLFHYLASALLFSAAIWLRYEYAILAFLLLPFMFLLRRQIDYKYLFLAAIALIASLSPILYLNRMIYGGVFTTGSMNIPGASGGFLDQIFPDFEVDALLLNVKIELFDRSPLLMVIGLLGASIFLYRGRGGENERYFAFYLVFSALYFLYRFGAVHGYGGYGTHMMISSYNRYFLLVYLVLELFGAFFIVNFASHLTSLYGGKIRSSPSSTFRKDAMIKVVVLLLLASLSVYSIHYVFSAPRGLSWARNTAQEWRQIDKDVDSLLPEEAIVLTEFYSPYILSRRVFWSYKIFIPEFDPEFENILSTYVERLLLEKYPVYLIENEEYPWYQDLKGILARSSDFRIERIYDSIEIYRISLER